MGLYIRRSILMVRRILKSQAGTSIVSVIAAFVILMIGISMMTTAIMVSQNISNNSLKIRQLTEEALAAYYMGECAEESQEMNFTIQPAEGTQAAVYAQFKGIFTTYTYTTASGTERFLLYHFAAEE